MRDSPILYVGVLYSFVFIVVLSHTWYYTYIEGYASMYNIKNAFLASLILNLIYFCFQAYRFVRSWDK